MSTQRPRFEVAEVFRAHQGELSGLSAVQWKAVNAIINCRTAKLGGHEIHCDNCSHLDISYNSCGNRHCPKCGALAREKWLSARESDLLPVAYFHVVFTIPHELNEHFLWNKRELYTLLLKAVNLTITKAAHRNLGIQSGMLEVLHTWGQNLEFHPHVHCIVAGGGLKDGAWVSSRKDFFIHVRKLSRLFRGIFIKKLMKLCRGKSMVSPGDRSPLELEKLCKLLYEKDWVVYAKKPFAGPRQVLRYLGRYTHRVAISNFRLTEFADGKVSFIWKDYRNDKRKVMTLSAAEFMRRFLLHVLPRGFVKIRSCGFLSNCHKQKKLAVCRQSLGVLAADKPLATFPAGQVREEYCSRFTAGKKCPVCGVGHLILTELPGGFRIRRAGGSSPPE